MRNFLAAASGAATSAIFFCFWPNSAPELMNHPKKGRAPVSYNRNYGQIYVFFKLA